MYRADGLRARRVYGNTSNFEELSGFYDYNQLVNNATWGYYYDGQMLAWEDFTTYGEGNSLTIKDLTSYGLGARGIDVMIARRVSSDQSNDPLLTSSGLDTAVLGSTSRDRVSFPLYDGHGNTIATLARNGTGYSIANEKRYDVWGKVRSDSSVGSSGQILNPTQKYCGNLGHKYDATSGLTYMRARYYEAETGRFISEDHHAEGLNWYSYAHNNPINFGDASGNDVFNLQAELLALFQKAMLMTDPLLRVAWFSKAAFDVTMDWTMIDSEIATEQREEYYACWATAESLPAGPLQNLALEAADAHLSLSISYSIMARMDMATGLAAIAVYAELLQLDGMGWGDTP